MNTSAAPSAGPGELDSTTYNAFVAGLDLAGVELVKIHGERVGAGTATQIRFDLTATYMQDEPTITYRYQVDAYVIDNQDNPLGSAVATVQVTVSTPMTVNKACIEQFGGTSGALIAHPYLREAIASAAQRVGFPGILLPMIKQQPA